MKVDSGTDATVVGRDRTAAPTAASAHFNRSRIARRQFSVWSQFSDDANIYRAAPLRDHTRNLQVVRETWGSVTAAVCG